MSNDNKAPGAGLGITADQPRAISTLARTHKDQGAELTEKQFREMTTLQHQVGLAGYTVAGLPLSALALNEPNTVAYRLTDPAQSFQGDVATWMGQCFPPSLSSNMTERGDRLLEEVLELLQAHGYDSARVPTLDNYVFGRPVGEPAQEVGGVMVTLAAYCSVAGLSMQADGQAELDRINQPEVMARIRAKQEAKNALHFDTPLPGDAAQPSAAGQGDALAAIAAKLRAAGANLPAPPVTGTIEGSVVTGLSIALALVEEALAARQPVGQERVPFAVESKAFEAHAASRKLDLSQHPLHYLFLDRVTDEARQAWKAALSFDPHAQAVDLEQQQDAARWRAIAPHLQVEWDEDELLKRWTWIDFKRDALSVPTRSRESYANLNEAMDAVIDSQSTGSPQ